MSDEERRVLGDIIYTKEDEEERKRKKNKMYVWVTLFVVILFVLAIMSGAGVLALLLFFVPYVSYLLIAKYYDWM